MGRPDPSLRYTRLRAADRRFVIFQTGGLWWTDLVSDYPTRTGHNLAPEWSPDGRYLGFVSSPSSSRDEADRRVVLLPSGGGEAREFPTPAQRLWTLRWFGDSRGLGITGHDARGQRMLFRLTIATGEWQTFPLRASTSQLWNGMYFDWNTDGSRYCYAWQDDFLADLMIVERDLPSDRERIVYRGKPQDPMDRYSGLRFGPDRRSLSFRSRGGIRVLDIESGQARVLHDEVAGETGAADRQPGMPAWSTNGRALLVQRTDTRQTDGRDIELRLIPTDGGPVRRILFAAELTRLLSPRPGAPRPSIQGLAWSPDGSRLAIAVRASRIESFVIEDPLAIARADAIPRK